MSSERFIPIGQVISAHGVRGEIKFRYYNELHAGFFQYPSFFVEKDSRKVELKPSGVRFHRGFFLVKFEDLESLDQVSFLMRKELLIREEDLPPPGEDEYYDYQLIGLTAMNERNEPVGRVKEIIHTKANDIMVIEGQRELLVPMVDGPVISIDIEGCVVKVRGDAFVE